MGHPAMIGALFIAVLLVLVAIVGGYIGRQAGGGKLGTWLVYQAGTRFGAWWGSAASRLPEIIFALPFAILLGWPGAPISYLGIESGHGNTWRMTGVDGKFPDRPSSTEKWGGRWLFQRLGGDIHKPIYSWWIMGIKGLWIGLPAFPFGLLNAVWWPAAYWINFRLLKRPGSPLAEWLSCGGAWVLLALSILFV